MRRSLHPAWLVLPHAVLSFILLWHHEPWRDETHAWLLARGPASIAQLLVDIYHGEISPPLWHLLLRAVAACTDRFFVVGVLHWLVMVSAVALLMVRSPFRRHEKLLISLGCLFLFEYAVIVRHYGLSVLLLFAVLAGIGRPGVSWNRQGLLLALLVQTHIFGLILGAALWWALRREAGPRPWLGHAVVLVSLACSLFYLSAQTAMAGVWEAPLPGAARPLRLWYLTIFQRALLPIVSVDYFLPRWFLELRGCAQILAGGGLALLLLTAPRRGPAARAFWFAAAGLLFVYLKAPGAEGLRHHGFLFIAWLMALWLDRLRPGAAPGAPTGMDRLRTGAVTVMLLGHVWGSVNAVNLDLRASFSGSQRIAARVARIMASPQGKNALWATLGSGQCEGILAFLPAARAEFYSLELLRPYRYLVHDRAWKAADERARKVTPDRYMQGLLDQIDAGGYDRAYVIMPQIGYEIPVYKDLHLVPQLDPTMPWVYTSDENFIIHELRLVRTP